jgi:SAM-dependent methyltransferase
MSNWEAWRQTVDLDGYDARWAKMAASGENPHGEADFVCRYAPASVLDGGCGTGRLGIELARRGIDVVGADIDADLLARARAKAPNIDWHLVNLAAMNLGRVFDLVALAGNVIPYADAADRAEVIAACARHLSDGGRLVAGFSLRAGWPTLADYDAWCAAAGLQLVERYATWQGELFAYGDYAVSVHVKDAPKA